MRNARPQASWYSDPTLDSGHKFLPRLLITEAEEYPTHLQQLCWEAPGVTLQPWMSEEECGRAYWVCQEPDCLYGLCFCYRHTSSRPPGAMWEMQIWVHNPEWVERVPRHMDHPLSLHWLFTFLLHVPPIGKEKQLHQESGWEGRADERGPHPPLFI